MNKLLQYRIIFTTIYRFCLFTMLFAFILAFYSDIRRIHALQHVPVELEDLEIETYVIPEEQYEVTRIPTQKINGLQYYDVTIAGETLSMTGEEYANLVGAGNNSLQTEVYVFRAKNRQSYLWKFTRSSTVQCIRLSALGEHPFTNEEQSDLARKAAEILTDQKYAVLDWTGTIHLPQGFQLSN